MKIIHYELFGRVPSKDYFRTGSDKLYTSKTRFTKWVNFCDMQLQKQGKPNKPFGRLLLEKIVIHYPDFSGNPNNSDKYTMIQNYLIDSGIIKSSSFTCVPTSRIEGKHRIDLAGIDIYLTVDEDHPYNEGIVYDNLPTV